MGVRFVSLSLRSLRGCSLQWSPAARVLLPVAYLAQHAMAAQGPRPGSSSPRSWAARVRKISKGQKRSTEEGLAAWRTSVLQVVWRPVASRRFWSISCAFGGGLVPFFCRFPFGFLFALGRRGQASLEFRVNRASVQKKNRRCAALPNWPRVSRRAVELMAKIARRSCCSLGFPAGLARLSHCCARPRANKKPNGKRQTHQKDAKTEPKRASKYRSKNATFLYVPKK